MRGFIRMIPALCLLFLASYINASNTTIESDSLPTEVYVSTATPPSVKKMLGYSYGHAAIRFYNPKSNLDNIFSFDSHLSNNSILMIGGIFTNTQEKITRKESYHEYMSNAEKMGRAVTFQQLNVTPEEAQKIYIAMINIRNDKKIKLYHPIYANCSNGILELLNRHTTLVIPENMAGTTLRGEIARYCAEYYVWFNVLQNIGAGQEADKPMTNVEAAFLPAYLKTLLDETRIVHHNHLEPLVLNTTVVDYRFDREPHKLAIYNRPEQFIWIITTITMLFISLLLWIKKTDKLLWIGIIYIIYGALGLVFWTFDLALDYGMTWRNPMLLLFNPFELVFGILWCSTHWQRKIYYFLPIQALSSLLLLVFVFNKPLPAVTPAEVLLLFSSITAWFLYARKNNISADIDKKKA